MNDIKRTIQTRAARSLRWVVAILVVVPALLATAPAPASAARRAKLTHGRLVAPSDAPARVKNAIAAANQIRTKPYVYGAGHDGWGKARAYDCSSAVSYALHGGGFVSSPLVSGDLARWGAPGKGRWITVYANSHHTFAVIAGVRWDTSGHGGSSGPRWQTNMRSTAGFVARHPPGF